MRAKQAGIDLLNKAKSDQASRKRSADGDLKSLCNDAARFVWSKPMTVNINSSDFRKRRSKKCFVCGTIGGTFYINNGKAYCAEDKEAMNMPKRELKRYLSKRRSGQNVNK